MLEQLAKEVADEQHELVQPQAVDAEPLSPQALQAHREVRERHLRPSRAPHESHQTESARLHILPGGGAVRSAKPALAPASCCESGKCMSCRHLREAVLAC